MQVVTPGYRKMVNGKSYVLFLSQDATRANLLTPTNGPQGLFEFPADTTGDTKVKHYGRSLMLPPDDANAQTVAEFLKAVRKAAK